MLINAAKAVVRLIFPRLCILCNHDTPNEEQQFCVDCMLNMPYTNHFKRKENHATRKFWGRFEIVHAASLINFYSYSDVRWMIHRMKYEGRKDIAVTLGQMMGKRIRRCAFFKDIDIIIPIPLHKDKQKKRGFNQAYHFGKGISEYTKVPIREGVIIKHTHTKSQTQMSRIKRIQNVFDSFKLIDKNGIRGRHILIVDDVLTTGATIEACARILMESPGIKISIATACIARH